MKKIVLLLCATAFVSSPVVAFASGDDVTTETELNQQAGVVSESDELETDLPVEEIKELTLEVVITRGIENSKSLKTLQLKIEIMKNELKMARRGKKEATLKVDNGLDQLMKEEESVKQKLASDYFDLLVLQKQLETKKRYVQLASHEVTKNQMLYKHGKLTQAKLNEINRAKENEEKQLADMERSYQTKLTNLCSNIRITYDPAIELNPVQFDVELQEVPTDLSSLIENSSQVKRAERDLEAAISERRQVYRDDDTSKYEKENQDYYVDLAEQNLVSTKEEVQRSIEQLYLKAEETYLAYQEAIRQHESNQKGIDEIQLRYKFGKISDYGLEQAQLGLEAAELDVYQSKIQVYQMKQSIEALQKGFIL